MDRAPALLHLKARPLHRCTLPHRRGTELMEGAGECEGEDGEWDEITFK